jgi:hypothetical protein
MATVLLTSGKIERTSAGFPSRPARKIRLAATENFSPQATDTQCRRVQKWTAA